ncbi:MAG: hypothetical protein HQK59_05890 [Deltaproteobacteria bacterium]|nr:hypothetical protein [Deltaproteobacteria bacterium]
MEISVCDTSVLIRLRKGNVLHHLLTLFDKLYIPLAVKDECRDEIVSKIIQSSSFEIRRVNQVLGIDLGLGETEAISLAVELNIKTILIDDKDGIKKALQNGLKPIQSVELLVAVKVLGLIDSVKEVLETMKANEEYIADAEWLKCLQKAGEA